MKAKYSNSDLIATLLAGAGIGGVLMFFLDPRAGARRRALARDRTGRAIRTGKEELQQGVEDARNRISGAGAASVRTGVAVERQVTLPVTGATLEGTLTVPADARGVVLFAHGSGSSRFSPRNRYVAQVLRDAGLATLLVDLLSPGEEEVD